MRNSNKEIIFLVSSGISLGVLESQVFSFAEALANMLKRKIKVVVVGRKLEIERASKFVDFYNLNYDIFLSEIRDAIIYTRSIDVFLKFYLKLKLKNNYMIHDFRALLFVESYDRNKNPIKKRVIFLLELLTYILADDICAVSQILKKKIYSFFYLKRDIHVFPCLVFKKTELVSYNLKNTETINFVYLGGLSKWQMFDDILLLYKEISSKISNSNLTIITKQKKEALQKLILSGIDAKVITLTNKQVFEELKKHDFGFLVRENNIVNNVASPIKFLEYLRSGVIPLMTEGIGDFSIMAKNNRIAIVFNYGECIDVSKILKFKKDKDVQLRINDALKTYDYENRIKDHPIYVKSLELSI